MITGFLTFGAVLVGIVLFLGVMLWLMYKIAQADRNRRKRAIKATARIVRVGHSSNSREYGVSVKLGLEISPPQGAPYEVDTEWWVKPAASAKVQVGQTLAVKIDAKNPKVIYSAESGLSDMNA